MPYTLEYRVLPEYLEVSLIGDIIPGKELSEAKDRWTKIAALCKKEDRRLILAFMDLKGQHSIDSKFNLIDSASSFGWSQNYRLAIVTKGNELFHHLLFTETAMNNMGYEMKIFRKKREAKKWLFLS